jgi:nucleoside phosphorylase
MIFLITALTREAAAVAGEPLQAPLPIEIAEGLHLHVSGMGAERAEAAARGLLSSEARASLQAPAGAGASPAVVATVAGRPDSATAPVLLVSVGVAGALAPGLRSGDVVVADAVRESHEAATRAHAPQPAPSAPPGAARGPGGAPSPPPPGAPLPCAVAAAGRLADALLADGLRVHRGQVLSTRQVLATPADKHEHPGVLAVDTESAAIARVARAGGAGFLCVRAIVDEIDMTIPPAVLASTRSDGTTDPLALAGQLLRDPRQIVALVPLGRAWSRARVTLGRLKPAFVRLARDTAPATASRDDD